MGARLNRLGISYTIVEKAKSIGGVWRDNRYPGCGVDTPNHAYSFSFTPPNRWSRFFAPQPEIEQYLQRSADDCGVTPHIRFGTTVTSATWLDERQVWRVRLDGTDGNETIEVPFLVSAIGQLNEPSIPTIRGIDTFEGPCFHSARWPEHLDVTGLRVAVIGTGASSMQLVPAIADQVASADPVPAKRAMGKTGPPLSRPDPARLTGAVRTDALLRRLVPIHDAVAVRRRSLAVPSQGPDVATPRAITQQGQRPAPSGDDRPPHQRTRGRGPT